MRKTKILSLIIALAMILGTMTIGVSAAEDLPEAKLEKLAPMVLTADDGYVAWPSGDSTIDRPLNVVVKFSAVDTEETVLTSPYKGWYTDYYITFDGLKDGSLIADGCYLAGNYGTFPWIVIPTDGVEIEEGAVYPVVSQYDAHLTYEEICTNVKEMICAIYIKPEIIDANPDMTVTLNLGIKNGDEGEVVYVNSSVYDADELAGYVAKVGDKKYTSFADAVAEAQPGTTITLLADIANLDATISKNITIDLGGKTLTDAYIIVKKDDVEIKNGKIVNTDEAYPLVVQDGGELTVNDVDIEASKSDRAIWVRDNSTLNFESGSILATKGSNNTKSTIYGIWVNGGSTVNINGGTITVDAGSGATAVAVFGNYDNTVNMTDGKLSTSGKNYSYGIYTNGNITLSGGEIVTNEKQYGYSSGITYGYNYALNTNKNVTITGGAVTTYGPHGYLVNAGGSGQTINVSGITFENVLSEADKTKGGHSEPPVVKATKATVTISSGTFKGVSETEIVKGSDNITDTTGGTYNPAPAVAKIGEQEYETLADAFAEADGKTITLLNDVALEETITVAAGKTVTFDLNGYTVSGNFEESKKTVVIENYGTLTVKDSSDAKTGKITSHATNPDTGEIPGYASNTINNRGTFTLESGTIENTTSSGAACYAIDCYSANSLATINGGKVVGVKPAIRLFANSTTAGNSLVVNGGEIIGTRAIWIQLPGSKNEAKLASVEINGGTLTSNDAEYNLAIYSYSYGDAYNGTSLEINSGTINGYVALGGGSSYNGSGAENVRVTGGTFSKNIFTYNSTTDDDIQVSGGTFGEEVDAAYIAEGFKLVVNSNGTYGVAPEAGVVWTTATDAGFYTEDNAVKGMMRFLFHAGLDKTITASGIHYIDSTDITAKVKVGETETGESNAFHGDIINIPEGKTGRYYAVGFVVADGKYYWSDPVECEPNFVKEFTGYTGGVE